MPIQSQTQIGLKKFVTPNKMLQPTYYQSSRDFNFSSHEKQSNPSANAIISRLLITKFFLKKKNPKLSLSGIFVMQFFCFTNSAFFLLFLALFFL